MDCTHITHWILYILALNVNLGYTQDFVRFVETENDPCPGELYDVSLRCTVNPFVAGHVVVIQRDGSNIATNSPFCNPLETRYDFTCGNGTFDLVIRNVTESDNNKEWKCLAANLVEEDTIIFPVKVPINNHASKNGTGTTILECTACGFPAPMFEYQENNDKNISMDDKYLIDIFDDDDVSDCVSGSFKKRGVVKINPEGDWEDKTEYVIGCAPRLPYSSCTLQYMETRYTYVAATGLSGGAIAGIVLLSAAVVACIIGVLYVIFFRKPKSTE